MEVQVIEPGPILFVEGPDDRHVILHLLRQYGIEFPVRHDAQSGGQPAPYCLPKIKEIGHLNALLDAFVLSATTAIGQAVGAVVDANSPLAGRWEAVRNRFVGKGIQCPKNPIPEGFVAQTQYKTRVGVWLMPDNQQDGKLETFLQMLIDENDPLIEHARSATDVAKQQFGARFSDPDRDKAVIYAWLAWQKEPGWRLGTAVSAKFFDTSKPTAFAFVDWFRRLFLT